MRYLRFAAIVETAFCLFAVAFLVGLLNGCLPAREAAAERAYREDQEACLRQYESVNERRACVNRVRAHWAADGGAE